MSNARYERLSLKVEGVAHTIKAIKDFEPDLYKQMGASIRKSTRLLRDTAKRRRPEGIYKVENRITHKRGPRSSVTSWADKGGGMTVAKYLETKGKGEVWDGPKRTVIFEFAKQSAWAPMRAAIAKYEREFGSPGRFLWGAYDDIGEYVEADIQRAISDAMETFQDNLDSGVY